MTILPPGLKGRAMGLLALDIDHAARLIQCPPAAIRAVLAVETGGRSGFLPDGQPRVLFEAHIFSRQTGGRFDGSHPGISSPTWNRALYAKGPTADARGLREIERLQQAAALDEGAALRSASWGLFQLMGFNHRACGHDTVEAFAAAMCDSEGEQLDAFVRFVKARRLDDELRALDWPAFARGYNGPAYAQNRYDQKLAAAYNQALAVA